MYSSIYSRQNKLFMAKDVRNELIAFSNQMASFIKKSIKTSSPLFLKQHTDNRDFSGKLISFLHVKNITSENRNKLTK